MGYQMVGIRAAKQGWALAGIIPVKFLFVAVGREDCMKYLFNGARAVFDVIPSAFVAQFALSYKCHPLAEVRGGAT